MLHNKIQYLFSTSHIDPRDQMVLDSVWEVTGYTQKPNRWLEVLHTLLQDSDYLVHIAKQLEMAPTELERHLKAVWGHLHSRLNTITDAEYAHYLINGVVRPSRIKVQIDPFMSQPAPAPNT